MKRLMIAGVLLLGSNVCLAEKSIQECKDRVVIMEAMMSSLNKTIESRRGNGRAQTNFSRDVRQILMKRLSSPVTRDPKKQEMATQRVHARRKTV